MKIGIAGLGNVGAGLVERLQNQSELRLKDKIIITGISARNRNRDRSVSLSDYVWYDDPVALATSDQTDVFVELIGGSDGPAKLAVEAALRLGKPVVTANKALIAEHGAELAELARKSGSRLFYEAAVAGAIPIVRAVKESLAGTQIKSIRGILNGTCNYLLCEMLDTGRAYETVLADAQRLGYAEADPFLDVSGTDAAHKIAILATLGFGVPTAIAEVSIEGVDQISLQDLLLAKKLDHKIKLIAEARVTKDGLLTQVSPTLLPLSSPLAQVDGPLNAVMVDTYHAGPLTFTGPGAGAGPTASAVLGDLAALLSGNSTDVFGLPVSALNGSYCDDAHKEQLESKFFIRVGLADRAGALASLTDALAASDVSVDVILQDSAGDSDIAPIAVMTHLSSQKTVETALTKINALDAAVDPARAFRIEAE